ncbi:MULTISPECIES: hypothetical protein [unclassified Mesorhizobium]|nr:MULTISPECIES: hypothetical protein [unclassified Mesorhizobium]
MQFSGVTYRGILREAVFKGLREDLVTIPAKPPIEAAEQGGRTRSAP